MDNAANRAMEIILDELDNWITGVFSTVAASETRQA